MSTFGWVYFTAYNPNISQVFHNLRREVFATGDYFKPWGQDERYHAELLAKPESELSEVEKEALQNWDLIPTSESDAPPDPLPGTIDDLLRYNAEWGTRSILDVEDVREDLEIGMAGPIPSSVLERCFGTRYPTRAQVERSSSEWEEYRDQIPRHSAVYFPVYRNGTPDEIAFVGCSGG